MLSGSAAALRQARTSRRLSSGTSDPYAKYIGQVQQIAGQNSAWSAAQADKQMQFQQASADKAMQFNAQQAELSRRWQEYMSNTAHQREIKDLQAAGLNPILSAMGGSGAPVTSGATASGYQSSGAKGDFDSSASTSLVSLLGSMLSAQTSIANQALSAKTQESVADKYTAMSKLVAEIGQETSLSVAGINAAASRYAADRHASASVTAAGISAAAQRYGYDISSMTQRDIASFNADVNKYLAERGYDHDFDIRSAFPSNPIGLLSSIFDNSLSTSGRGLQRGGTLLDLIEEMLPSNRISSGRSASYGGGGGRSGK